MMKSKIEVAANVVVILLAVVIGSVFLMDRFASLGLGPNEIKAGDKLLGLRAYNWKAHERTLVLALRNGCHFCVWMGQLPAAEEAEVIAGIGKPPAAQPKQQSFLRAPFKTYKSDPLSGGGGGIRTPETLSSLTVFKTGDCALARS